MSAIAFAATYPRRVPEPLTLPGQRALLSPLRETHIDALLAAANESRENYTFTQVAAVHRVSFKIDARNKVHT